MLLIIPLTEYCGAINIPSMEWGVEYTDEFGAWLETLSEKEQIAVAVTVGLLERMGPGLPFPHSSSVYGSRRGHMRELRTQCDRHPLRTLHAFNPRRVAILLIGGDKTGNDRWYEIFVPIADRLYDEHLKEIAVNSPKNTGGSHDKEILIPPQRHEQTGSSGSNWAGRGDYGGNAAT